jgi:hypothetical protein
MQNDINKLVKRVRNPEIVGMLVYGKFTAFSCFYLIATDILFNRLQSHHIWNVFEIGWPVSNDGNEQFYTARDSNDVLLMPVILESVNQICSIVNKSIKSLYQTTEGDEDVCPFTRKQCDSPVMVNYNDINNNKNWKWLDFFMRDIMLTLIDKTY